MGLYVLIVLLLRLGSVISYLPAYFINDSIVARIFSPIITFEEIYKHNDIYINTYKSRSLRATLFYVRAFASRIKDCPKILYGLHQT